MRHVRRSIGIQLPHQFNPFESRIGGDGEMAFINDPPLLTSWGNVERAAEDFYASLIPLKRKLTAWAEQFYFTRRGSPGGPAIPVSDQRTSTELTWSWPIFSLRNPSHAALDTRIGIQISVTYLRDRVLSESAQFFDVIVDPNHAAAVQDYVSDRFGLFDIFGDPIPSRIVPFSAQHRVWNPCSEPLAVFQASYRKFIDDVSRKLEREFQDHIGQVNETLRERGFRPIRSKINPQQYDNLALYQILGLSPGEIARRCKYPITEIAIFKGVQRIAGEIGVSLRPPRRGPKAKSRGRL
jgi:hypothetical protein